MTDKITMDAIAKMAGVTKSTVSRYFNGGSVKESTRKRIQAVAQKHRYEPNTFARLNAKESNRIGVVLPTLTSKVTGQVITSIDRYLRQQGYETLIKSSDHNIELELQNMQRLLRLQVDGILLSAITMSAAHEKMIAQSKVPIVVLAQDFDKGIIVVDDDYCAGKCMGEYVGRSRPEKVGYIGVAETDFAVGVQRKQGVIDGLRACGIPEPIILQGDYSYESGQRMTEVLLEAAVDAIICATDRLAFGAYRVIAEKGLRIPEDVSVTGFGGYEESALLKPALTTLRFDPYAMGYLGAETLLKMIKEEPVPKKQVIDYVFIPGESVKNCKSCGFS